MTDDVALVARAAAEIEAVHDFFDAWFRGELDDAAFDRFADALDDDFHIVGPNGRRMDRSRTLDLVRAGKASGHRAITVRNIALLWHHGDVIAMGYEDWQGERGRLSSAVFRDDRQAPGGLRWMLVHETWLET